MKRIISFFKTFFKSSEKSKNNLSEEKFTCVEFCTCVNCSIREALNHYQEEEIKIPTDKELIIEKEEISEIKSKKKKTKKRKNNSSKKDKSFKEKKKAVRKKKNTKGNA